MRNPLSTILLVPTVLVLALTGLTACGGKAARERSQALLESQSGEKWFCQIAEDLVNWDCVQSNELAAAPVPERMPVPRDELLAAERASLSREASVTTEMEVALLEVDEAGVEAEIVEVDVIETFVETDVVVETVGVDPEVIEEIDEIDVGETEAFGLEVDGTQAAETNVVELDVDDTNVAETDVVELGVVTTEADASDLASLDLYTLPDDAFVVQLVAMRSARTLDNLINDRGLAGVFPVRVAVDGDVYHVLVTGPYDDEQSAQEFAAAPPDQLQDFQPWVRSARSLKAAMREADELNATDADEQG